MYVVFGVISQKGFCIDEQVVADLKWDFSSAGGIADI